MGGFFSAPKIPSPPPAVESRISEGEKSASRAEADKKQQLARRSRARATGGRRLLLAARDSSELGVPFNTTDTLGVTRG